MASSSFVLRRPGGSVPAQGGHHDFVMPVGQNERTQRASRALILTMRLQRASRARPEVRDMETTKKARGFASMDPEKQRAIARKGGESVPREKRSFSQNAELAAEAGRKGGRSVSPSNRSFARDKDLAKTAGRKGGRAALAGVETERR
jgi:general stress protein YciG